MSEYVGSNIVVLDNTHIIKKGQSFYINNPAFKNKLGLLKCYAPWCPHCSHMVDDLKYIADALKGFYVIGAIDCDVHKDVAIQMGLNGYPTLFYIDINGKVCDQYEGPRDKLTIVNNIKNNVKNMA